MDAGPSEGARKPVNGRPSLNAAFSSFSCLNITAIDLGQSTQKPWEVSKGGLELGLLESDMDALFVKGI